MYKEIFKETIIDGIAKILAKKTIVTTKKDEKRRREAKKERINAVSLIGMPRPIAIELANMSSLEVTSTVFNIYHRKDNKEHDSMYMLIKTTM